MNPPITATHISIPMIETIIAAQKLGQKILPNDIFFSCITVIVLSKSMSKLFRVNNKRIDGKWNCLNSKRVG
jgi:hypothetical protein